MATSTQRLRNNARATADETQENDNNSGYENWDPIVYGVKLFENYVIPIETFFSILPEFISTLIATISVFTLGSTLRGEWVIILVSALKQISGHTQTTKNMSTEEIYGMFTQENMKLENFGTIFIAAHTVSFGSYFLIGGFLHWYYYMRRRHLAHEWKIQPTKWLTPELERHSILLAVFSLFISSSFSSFIACYIFNGNPSAVYFQFDEYGWWWLFLQIPVIFIYIDYSTYFLHRFYHIPWMYKKFHKVHHKYKQPTAFSVTAVHPVELMHFQLTMSFPLFVVPMHYSTFYLLSIYNFYHGIILHSGVHIKPHWWQPWQPSPVFHDEHHEFFHCNFGFNTTLWDRWHGTIRKPNVLYTEDRYVGQEVIIGSPESKKIIESDPDAKEYYERSKAKLNE